MISDAELLKLVMERYPEQPTPFIIEQFTVLKAGLIQANNKLAAMDMEEPVCEQVNIEEPMPEAAAAALPFQPGADSCAALCREVSGLPDVGSCPGYGSGGVTAVPRPGVRFPP